MSFHSDMPSSVSKGFTLFLNSMDAILSRTGYYSADGLYNSIRYGTSYFTLLLQFTIVVVVLFIKRLADNNNLRLRYDFECQKR